MSSGTTSSALTAPGQNGFLLRNRSQIPSPQLKTAVVSSSISEGKQELLITSGQGTSGGNQVPGVVAVPGGLQRSLFKEPDCVTITTDASLDGWGDHLHTQMTQGRWSKAEASHSINWLELQAVHLALMQFQGLVGSAHVLVLTDNTTTKANINRQRGLGPGSS